MTAVGWMGIWLLVAGVGLIVVELAVLAPRLLRLQRKAVALRTALDREGGMRDLELQRLRFVLDEIDFKLRPFRRLRRVALHPLTLALLASYRRRRARR
jgi:hypothetical protein